ncbi:MAG TPA: AAA family ATPase, partial [Ktedonobacteraceae bacterium]|nr:AAA family ATPase [Ktedonobacteraceae bacterium]
MSSTSGVVEDEILTYHQGELAVTIPIETPDWQSWLENATSFTFRSKEGSFTAQKLRASNGRGGWYWYAYRRQHGHLSNFYLGTSSRLTRKRLDEAARSLAQAGTRYTSVLPVDEIERPEPDTNPLLLSKLHIPRLSPQHISRPRLLKLLDEGTQRPLTLISAPAGSGKTTLLVEWATTTLHSLAWISLEATDNDPSRFLSYLLEALASLNNGRETNYHPTKAQSPEHALATMLNGLTRSLQEDTILVLDDYHLLTSEAISALLRFLIDHLPAHLHLLLGTRIDPPLPLARLRARGQLSEIGLQELRFRSEEVDALVQTMGLSLSSEATNLLEQHAEGWAAGIQLLALALRGQPNATAFLRAFQGTHRFLLDYVSEEVLKQQTPEVQHFLLSTCMLTSMNGSLCEAMTGLPDGQARLEDLRHANLFVSTLDDAESLYRYHPLFAETLRAYLQKTEPELLPELYLRASSWYEQHQNIAEACEYALLAEDFSRVARLMTGIFPQMIEQGRIEQLSRWLSQLPPALIADSPQLYIATPWLYSFSQRLPEQREQAFKRMQQHVDKQRQKSGSTWTEAQSVLTLFQALTAMSQSNLSRAFSLIRKALRALTARQTALSQLISRLLQIALSVMYGESGDLASAEQILLDLSIAQPEQPFSLISLAAPFLLGELYKAQGKLHKAEALYEGLGNITPLYLEQQGMPLLVVGFTLMRKASLLYEWNRLADAAYGIQQVLEILPRAVGKTIPRATQPALLAFGLWVRAHIELAQGYPETARYFLDQVCQQPEIMAASPKEKSPVDIPVLAARLALACGRLEDAIHWENTCEIRFDDT